MVFNMSVVTIVPSPNPKALTFKIAAPHMMGNLQKLVLLRSAKDDVRGICPFADRVFDAVPGTSRAEFFQDDKECHITFMSNLLPWSSAPKITAQLHQVLSVLVDHAIKNSGRILSDDLAKERLDAYKTYTPAGQLEAGMSALFNNTVSAELSKDGGAMELVGIQSPAQSGPIQMKVLMLGSCSGCGSADERTLGSAKIILDTFLKSTQENAGKTVQFEKVQINRGFVIA